MVYDATTYALEIQWHDWVTNQTSEAANSYNLDAFLNGARNID